jgi:penicillin-binding protein A
MSNKTKSKIFVWAVTLCLAQAIAIIWLVHHNNGGPKLPFTTPGKSDSVMQTGRENVLLDRKGGFLYSENGKTRVVYTVEPKLQEIAEGLFAKYDPVLGVFVAIDPGTGAVRVSAVYSRKKGGVARVPYSSILDPAARSSSYPMASIAKLITACAAFRAGLQNPDDSFNCEGRLAAEGGSIKCAGVHGNITMAQAIAKSCNTTFGKIAMKVGREKLYEEYERFGFNRIIGYDLPLLESTAVFAGDDYSMIRAGSGFEGAWISPVHAALIATAIENRGMMPKPYIVASVSSGGIPKYHAHKSAVLEPIDRGIADKLASMMELTVNIAGSTAYKGFYKNGKTITGDMHVVGKTGSLNGESDEESYTWFVGFVRKGSPDLAFATLVMNDDKWKIKAASYTGQFFSAVSNKYK